MNTTTYVLEVKDSNTDEVKFVESLSMPSLRWVNRLTLHRGTERILQESYKAVIRDWNGHIVGVTETWRDVPVVEE